MSDKLFVIPDVHGMSDLLRDALTKIHSMQNGGRIVFLGDYIDRGPDSVGVCRLAMHPKEGWEHVCLMGNHEFMFLRYLDQESPLDYFYDENAARELMLAPDVVKWMRDELVVRHRQDGYLFVHAYDDPTREHTPLGEALWQRYSDSESYRGKDFLVHGHTPRVNGPVLSPNRMNMDCGAFYYGRLVVMVIDLNNTKAPFEFIEVSK